MACVVFPFEVPSVQVDTSYCRENERGLDYERDVIRVRA